MFSIYDHRCEGYLGAGRNSPTKEKCVNECIEWFTEDWTPEHRKEAFNGDADKKAKQLMLYDYEVEEHSQIIIGQGIKPESISKDGTY